MFLKFYNAFLNGVLFLNLPPFAPLVSALVHMVVVLRGHFECRHVRGQSHLEQESVERQAFGGKLDPFQHVCGAHHPRLLDDFADFPRGGGPQSRESKRARLGF